MSGGDHYPIARNNLPYLESHYSAAFALFQYLGDDDSVHEYGTFRDLPIGEIRIALRHFVFMCDEKGYEVEFRGDVVENYVRGMTAVKKCKMRCGGCRVRWYCSKECQVLHWKRGGHKQECQALLQSSAAEKAQSDQLANSSMPTWCN